MQGSSSELEVFYYLLFFWKYGGFAKAPQCWGKIK
jgi:hypothetical protein